MSFHQSTAWPSLHPPLLTRLPRPPVHPNPANLPPSQRFKSNQYPTLQDEADQLDWEEDHWINSVRSVLSSSLVLPLRADQPSTAEQLHDTRGFGFSWLIPLGKQNTQEEDAEVCLSSFLLSLPLPPRLPPPSSLANLPNHSLAPQSTWAPTPRSSSPAVPVLEPAELADEGEGGGGLDLDAEIPDADADADTGASSGGEGGEGGGMDSGSERGGVDIGSESEGGLSGLEQEEEEEEEGSRGGSASELGSGSGAEESMEV